MFQALLRLLPSPSPPPAEVRAAPMPDRRGHLAPRPVAGLRSVPGPVRELGGRCRVIDAETIIIGGTKIRIAGIDAPALDQPEGRAAKAATSALCKDRVITAVLCGTRSGDRLVARCYLPDGTDLAAELLRQGLASGGARSSREADKNADPANIRRELRRAAEQTQERTAAPAP